jgi:hypothetical protein
VEAGQRGHKTKKTLEIDPLQAETVRLIFKLVREGDGSSGSMGVKSVAAHLNAHGIRTRDGGRWGIGAVHKVLTRTTYVGRHRFNTRHWKTGEKKPEAEVVEMVVPPIIDAAEFEAVQALLKTRGPALSAPRRQRPDPSYRHPLLRDLRHGHDASDRKARPLLLLHLLDQGPAGRNGLQGMLDPDGEVRRSRRRPSRKAPSEARAS